MRVPRLLPWLGALVLVAWLAVVWPTRYRAVAIVPTSGLLAAREDRFTGRLEWLTRTGWQPAPRHRSALERLRALGDSGPQP